MVIEKDVEMENRKLKRVKRRWGEGIERIGELWGNGRGDIEIGFKKGINLENDEKNDLIKMMIIKENRIENIFREEEEENEEEVLK